MLPDAGYHCACGGQGLLAFAHPLHLNQQLPWTTQDRTGTIGRRVYDQARLLQPTHEFCKRDFCFHARQRYAEAQMYAAAKTQMLVIAPLGIKAIWVPEP